MHMAYHGLQRRLRLWLVNPGNTDIPATLTSLINITTRHTNAIRSILWQPECDKIFTAGADKRVSVAYLHYWT